MQMSTPLFRYKMDDASFHATTEIKYSFMTKITTNFYHIVKVIAFIKRNLLP